MSIAAALRAQVSDLYSAISRQERILDDMRSRLQDLQSQLESIAYPILTLPPELVSEIFIHCLPAERFTDVVNPSEAPLLLTHVCRAWRQIAISTPALWATFDINDMLSLPRIAEITQTWFERARKCPLTVSIRGYLPTVHDDKALGDFMDTFRRHSREVRFLELQLDLLDLYTISSDSLEVEDFPMLQKLSISLEDNSGEDPADFDPLVRLKNVPLLHEVLITVVGPSLVVLPWQQLTKFTGKSYYAEECLDAIRLMPNLVDCAFSAFEERDGDVDRLEAVSHPNMQHLTLLATGFYPPSCAHIIRLLTLPALQTLVFSGTDNFDAEELNSFLQRSSPPLRKLAVHPLEGGVELQLSSPFSAFIGLVELEIWRPARNFLSSFLTTFGCDTNLLPQLRKLAFLGCRIPEDEEDDMEPEGGANVDEILRDAAEPVTKRRKILLGCAQLQSFRVTSKKLCESVRYSEEDLLPFKKLKESGMDVHIGTQRQSVV
ncbi:hypothetical protein DFH08DRAFT_832193 [Mycena albidolilacea]|uniref:F-box domain-containing protein n=1 Tax=Mycena albidolilacea TaxID=1033008 RepID=A0AAD7AVH9_9AGAR|nr:hypothetical protein DFH08DRAFT_832193 [Mycena albidolilacea]